MCSVMPRLASAASATLRVPEPSLARDERHGGEIGGSQSPLARECVPRWRDEHELIVAPRDDGEPRIIDRAFHERDLHAALERGERDIARVGGRDAEGDARMRLPEAREMAREQIGGDRGARADAEHAGFEPSNSAELFLGHAFDGEELARPRQQRGAGIGEPVRARGPIEQRRLQLAFELAHRLGHGGLAEVQRFRRAGEASELGDASEDAEMVKVQGHDSWLCQHEKYVFGL